MAYPARVAHQAVFAVVVVQNCCAGGKTSGVAGFVGPAGTFGVWVSGLVIGMPTEYTLIGPTTPGVRATSCDLTGSFPDPGPGQVALQNLQTHS